MRFGTDFWSNTHTILVFCVQFVTLATSSRYLCRKRWLVGSTNVRKRTGSLRRIGAVQCFFIQLKKTKKLWGSENFNVFSTPPLPRRHLACMHGHIHHFLGVVSVFGGTSRQGKSIFFSSVKKCCRELFECFRLLFRASRLLSSFSCFMKMREIFNTTEL